MKLRLLILAALTGCATVPPPAPPGKTVTISPERVAQCEQAGGCTYLSRAEIADAMRRAYAMGSQAAAMEFVEGLDSQGCKRGNT